MEEEAEERGSQEGGPGGGVSLDTPETTLQTELPRSGGQWTGRITLQFVGSAKGLPRMPRIEGAAPREDPDRKLRGKGQRGPTQEDLLTEWSPSPRRVAEGVLGCVP